MSADEEKTRILQRRPAVATPRPPVAAAGGGKIVFHCPNGHRIVASAALAGKRGKCSKCQVDVTIPLPGGVEAAAAPLEPGAPGDHATPPSAVEPAPAPDAGDFPEITVGPPPPPPVVGGPGNEGQVGPPEPEGEERENWSFIGGDEEASAPEGFEAPAWGPGDGGGFPVESGNPTAVLVARLWAEREHGGIIELHLEGGSVILPEWYDAAWSRGTHGLFASQAADGSVTLTAVAWETVRKVVVRQLSEVPDDMFT